MTMIVNPPRQTYAISSAVSLSDTRFVSLWAQLLIK